MTLDWLCLCVEGNIYYRVGSFLEEICDLIYFVEKGTLNIALDLQSLWRGKHL